MLDRLLVASVITVLSFGFMVGLSVFVGYVIASAIVIALLSYWLTYIADTK